MTLKNLPARVLSNLNTIPQSVQSFPHYKAAVPCVRLDVYLEPQACRGL